MNLVGGDGVAVEIPDGLDLVGFTLQLYLVGLHHLLQHSRTFTQPHTRIII